jgi:hypothetical protein
VFVCSSLRLRLRLGHSRSKLANIEGDTRRRGDNIAGNGSHTSSDAASSHSILSMRLHIAGCLALLVAMEEESRGRHPCSEVRRLHGHKLDFSCQSREVREHCSYITGPLMQGTSGSAVLIALDIFEGRREKGVG